MKPTLPRRPLLERLYRQHLNEASPAAFIREVARRYTNATLARLAETGFRDTRRAATLALGYLADFRANLVLTRRLRDSDRGVRLAAEDALRRVWRRDGSPTQRRRLREIIRWNASGQHRRAHRESSRLLEEAPGFAEVWRQRSLANAGLGRVYEAMRDSREALIHNPQHFAAAVELGDCYLQLDRAAEALACYELALDVHPGLERARLQAARLRRRLGGGSREA